MILNYKKKKIDRVIKSKFKIIYEDINNTNNSYSI